MTTNCEMVDRSHFGSSFSTSCSASVMGLSSAAVGSAGVLAISVLWVPANNYVAAKRVSATVPGSAVKRVPTSAAHPPASDGDFDAAVAKPRRRRPAARPCLWKSPDEIMQSTEYP